MLTLFWQILQLDTVTGDRSMGTYINIRKIYTYICTGTIFGPIGPFVTVLYMYRYNIWSDRTFVTLLYMYRYNIWSDRTFCYIIIHVPVQYLVRSDLLLHYYTCTSTIFGPIGPFVTLLYMYQYNICSDRTFCYIIIHVPVQYLFRSDLLLHYYTCTGTIFRPIGRFLRRRPNKI